MPFGVVVSNSHQSIAPQMTALADGTDISIQYPDLEKRVSSTYPDSPMSARSIDDDLGRRLPQLQRAPYQGKSAVDCLTRLPVVTHVTVVPGSRCRRVHLKCGKGGAARGGGEVRSQHHAASSILQIIASVNPSRYLSLYNVNPRASFNADCRMDRESRSRRQARDS